MTEEAAASQQESLAAILGFILLQNDGEIRIPAEALEEGLPEDSGVGVRFDEETDELVVHIAKRNG